uniref:GG17016 n=1 Tax=Drosophila erecta TaxID=7220 RepID=B3P3Y7_DROER
MVSGLQGQCTLEIQLKERWWPRMRWSGRELRDEVRDEGCDPVTLRVDDRESSLGLARLPP